MATVCILGTGDIGGNTAQALAAAGVVSRILLIDPARGVAAGKALDIQQAGAITGCDTTLAGTDDWSRLTGSAACIVADAGRPAATAEETDARHLLERVDAYAGDAPIVFADASQGPALMAAAHACGLHRDRLIGSPPQAIKAAVTALVALEAGCSPADVMLTVLGAPAARFVVPWSEASIGGHAMERVLSQARIARIEARAERLWPPGPIALARAAAAVTGALLQSSRRTWCVSLVLQGEFGVRTGVGIAPVQLSPAGIAEIRVPVLNPRERVRVDVALAG
jgi:malate dehydrogenase